MPQAYHSRCPTTRVAGTSATDSNVQRNYLSTACADSVTSTSTVACRYQVVDSVNRTTELLTIPDNWPTASPRHGDSIDLDYLHPLVVSMIGDHECEDLISQISDGQQTVATLDMQIRTWVSEGFSLDHDNTLLGKFHAPNYTSALEQFRSQTTKSLIKRLQTHKTVGPFSWSGTVEDLP